jgi:hypothetical protein
MYNQGIEWKAKPYNSGKFKDGRFGDIDKNVANILKECKIQVSTCQCNQSVIHTHHEKEFVPVF